MIAILTGDVIGSRTVDSKIWLSLLEESLRIYSFKFDIFRGDSFQAEVSLKDTFVAAFYIKAALMTVQLDARIGIGIGNKDVNASHVKHSFGSGLLFSGEAFDALKKDTLRIKSSNPSYDDMCNVMMGLSTSLASRWTINMAETVMVSLQYPEINQQELSKKLNRKYQSQVSAELQRAAFHDVKKAIDYCTNELLKI
ncbi:hypothetical protein E2P86_07660 [Sphingobacterium psychroaquaticum]|uniref:hypothetical protein n=1 Tax=Sphingobacterium psychroaquaticum TaxID=561061 RepID=UPI00106B86C7|nr:hypothetical protein [Sphingobacterium psychroaquaticum]QBQ41032.1 hypothetical protein E2P86_07660 [Sphingobacterium psychroaquaticum]